VIKLEQHRTLQEKDASLCVSQFHYSGLSLEVRCSSGLKIVKLNRQIPELKHPVTYRKQTTETCPNRQKIQKRARSIFKLTSPLSARDFDTSATRKMDLPPRENDAISRSGHTTSNRKWPANRCHRKQTIKPCLTEARTHIRETAFASISRISAAPSGDELRSHSEASETLSQSSNLSETYGRS
jgi:hypothetical protein